MEQECPTLQAKPLTHHHLLTWDCIPLSKNQMDPSEPNSPLHLDTWILQLPLNILEPTCSTHLQQEQTPRLLLAQGHLPAEKPKSKQGSQRLGQRRRLTTPTPPHPRGWHFL